MLRMNLNAVDNPSSHSSECCCGFVVIHFAFPFVSRDFIDGAFLARHKAKADLQSFTLHREQLRPIR